MKKWLFRVENLLLLLPLALYCWISIIAKIDAIDIHLHDTYYIVASHFALLFALSVFAVLIIPYCFHLRLRIKQKGNKRICLVHIVITLILSFLFLFTSAGFSNPGVAGWHTTIYPPGASPFVFAEETFILVWCLFVLVQLCFIIYAITKLLQKKLP